MLQGSGNLQIYNKLRLNLNLDGDVVRVKKNEFYLVNSVYGIDAIAVETSECFG